MQIENRREEEPTTIADEQFRRVPDPALVRKCGLEAPLEQIRRHRLIMLAHRRRAVRSFAFDEHVLSCSVDANFDVRSVEWTRIRGPLYCVPPTDQDLAIAPLMISLTAAQRGEIVTMFGHRSAGTWWRRNSRRDSPARTPNSGPWPAN